MKLNENGLGLTETCNMQAYSYECMRHICSVNQCLPLSYYTRLSIPLSGINNRKSNSLTTSYTEREKLIRPTRYDLQSIPHSHRDTNYGSHIRSNRTNKKISTFYNQQIASSLYTIAYWKYLDLYIRDLPTHITGTTGNQQINTRKSNLKVDLDS